VSGPAVVKLCSLECLGDLITAEIPELVDRVCIGVPPNTHEQTYPSLAIRAAGRWKFMGSTVEELTSPLLHTSVRRVGHHEGMVQLRVLASSPAERDALAQAVVNVFVGFEDEDGYPHPGTVLARVTRCGLVTWTACFDLDDEEWVDTGAFNQLYEGLIQVEATIPALVCKPGVPRIETLVLGLTHDLTTTASAAMMLAPTVEVVLINENGSIEPYAP
jgi:hypothetical protein